MKNLLRTLLICLTAFGVSCKKSGVEKPALQQLKPLVTAPGIANGNPVSQMLNAANGGIVTSADGKIKISIPPGALPSDETITIQPVTNTMGFGIGKAYRLLPHGIQFNQPVTITFNYTDSELAGTAAELLGIGYQDEQGAWQCMRGIQVNEVDKQLSVSSTHFSDWGYFPLVYISPAESRVATNETVGLQVMYALPPDVIDVVALLGSNTNVYEPSPLLAEYIKGWNLTGTGTLSGQGNAATYRAPANPPAQNPEAVTAEIKMARMGFFLLVSNITVMSDFHIDYMQVDETEMNIANPPLNYVSRLFIYGNFGNDPGVANRSVKLHNANVPVFAWSPKVIICEIPAIGPLSSGDVTISSGGVSDTKLLNEWTVDFYYAKKESPDGSLTRKTTFVLRFRGDAINYGSGETQPMVPSTNLNKLSKAIIDMPAGSFSNAVTQDACGTYTVNWAPITGHVDDRSLNNTGEGFSGVVVQTATGFGVKLKYNSGDILTSTRIFNPCIGSTTQQIVQEPVTFEGYHEETIFFPFSSHAARTAISAGAPQPLIGTGAAPGLFWDAIDVNSQQFQTKIWWDEAIPKYN